MNAPFNIRASSLAELFDCPARWEAKNVFGRTMAAGAAARLGTAVHEATTIFDYAALNGQSVTIEQCDAVLHEQIWQPTEDVDWTDLDQNSAEKTAQGLVRRYISDIAPTQTYIGIEVRAEALTLADVGITLTGTIDRIYETEDGDLGIGDIKTGKTAVSADGTVKTAGHGLQMGVYTLLASHAIGEAMEAPARIYGLTTGKTAKGQHAGIGEIPNPTQALLGNETQVGMLYHAGQILKNGLFYGNPKSTLCSAKYCPAFQNCPFRK